MLYSVVFLLTNISWIFPDSLFGWFGFPGLLMSARPDLPAAWLIDLLIEISTHSIYNQAQKTKVGQLRFCYGKKTLKQIALILKSHIKFQIILSTYGIKWHKGQ